MKYTDIAPIFDEQEFILWSLFNTAVPDGETPENVTMLEALIRTLPVVKTVERRTHEGDEPYVELIGFVPTMTTAKLNRCEDNVIKTREEPRFLWISLAKGDDWVEACMADEHGLDTFEHMTI